MSSVTFSLATLLVAASAGTGMPTVAPGASASYQPQRWKHVSGREEDVQAPPIYPSPSAVQANPSDISRSSIPVMSTGSTFFARWKRGSAATGYRLDVSQQESFNSYVDGYRDLDVGNMTGRVVTGLSPGTKYYYRVRAYNAAGSSADSQVMVGTTASVAGLIINPTFDSSITNNPNALAIQSMISRAVSIFENLVSDPITVPILFRYSASDADGSSLGGALSDSISALYPIPWNTYIGALRAHATSNNDTTANASLPATALSPNVEPSGANGRAIGLNTPPAVSANGKVGSGAGFIYDGVITLNSSDPFQFTRPVNSGNFDAQRSTEHEIDEVLGLGSHVNGSGRNLEPQDLFSWSSPGTRNLTSSGTRYFSINSGATDIIDFNQDSSGDFGDWLSPPCPQPAPYVQNAFGCTGQSSDVSASSPEGTSLDVIGYTLATSSVVRRTAVLDFNGDGKTDYVLYNAATRQTAIWYLNNNAFLGGAYGPTLPPGWGVAGTADFNSDSHPDYALFNFVTHQTALWYLSGPTFLSGAYGPTLPNGWELVATADFNGDNKPDYVLYNAGTHQTAIWYLNNNAFVSGAYGPTLPAGWSVVGVADFDRDSHADYALFNPGTRQTAIWYLSGATFIRGAYGPTLPSGWALVATADFNGDGHPDYVLENANTRQTAIWYLNNNAFVSGAFGPTLPAGWSLVAP
jgi:FG-GAP-like repeat/Fibronectin type III domain